MGERPKRIKAPAPDGWAQVAAAVREVRDQIRESFGPRLEYKLDVSDAVRALDKVRPLVVEATPEEMADPLAVRGLTKEALGRRIRDDVLTYCGFVDGGEVTADGSADNDLAHERADAVMDMLAKVDGHSYPAAVVPPAEGASLHELLSALRPLVYRVVNATAAPGQELTENVDVIMAFLNLAREHSDPKRLLPRGDRLGGWLPPGTPVTLHLGKEGESEYSGVVEPSRDMVTVRLDGSGVVTDFPRNRISKEGEPWTPPKPTDS